MKNPPVTAAGSGPTVAERRARVAALRAESWPITKIADELECSFPTIARDLKALGLPALERERRGAFVACPRCGAKHYRAPSEMHKRFCRECYLAEVSHAPPPTDRTCRQCGKLLSFKHPKDAVGRGYYCDDDCYRASLPARVRVTCPVCETVRERPPSHAHKRFCSTSCRARYHFRLGNLRHLVERWNGDSRRLWKLKWAPKPGRPRNYTDEQAAWVLSLAAQGYGHERIVQTTGLSRDTVRRIRGREKRS